MQSLSERLTARFYEWEQRGRGWELFDAPVDPEPSFHPFLGHYVQAQKVIDDGFRPSIFQRIGNLLIGKKQEVIKEPETDIPPIEANLFESDAPLVAISVTLPKEQKVEADEMEQLLLMLSNTNCPVSFEIIGTNASIRIQFVCREQDARHIHSQVKAFFPSATVLDLSDTGLDILSVHMQTCFIDFGLAHEFMYPLQMADGFDPDPFIGLFGTLEHLEAGERIILQILFKGATSPWAESILRSVSDNTGSAFFSDAPGLLKQAQEKISSPLYGVCIRVIGQGSIHERAEAIAGKTASTIRYMTRSQGNELIPLSTEGYAIEEFCSDIESRQTHRLGMILNLRELGMLMHLPSPSVTSPKLSRIGKKTKAAPDITEKQELFLGVNEHQGYQKPVTLSTATRMRHMHVMGATGTGKSTFLLNIICEDIEQGRSLCVIDPHGDLIESILARIPEKRIDDVIIIDPADADYPVGFNILSAHSEIEKEILSSDLIAVFRRLSTSWGDQMNSVFANAILAFLESTEGGTLSDLRRFLLEPVYRNSLLKTVKDPNIVYYWQHSFPILKSSSLGPILTRLDTFLRPKLIRNMVVQKKSLDFENILDTKKILLVKLSQGLIGTENSYLLGSFIVSKIYQAAMARQGKSQTERTPFFLYIDEFQNYITPSLSAILSGGRKYALGLVLAHQEMQQIQKYDTELASSVITNPATRICFRLGDIDAKKFEDGFSFFAARDLQDLKTGEAIVRIDRPEYDFNLSVSPLPEMDREAAIINTEVAISHSRSKYGTPREQVEASFEYLAQPVQKEPVQETVVKERQPEQEKPKHIPQPIEVKVTAAPEKKTETRHQYLQTLIARMAQSRGYKASIEQPTPDGKGRVDVSLERSGVRIACEVSVTTGDIWEVHNIEKCLAAGYMTVIVCSEDVKNLFKISKQVNEKLTKDQQAKVLTFEPQELFRYLDQQIVQESNTEKVVKGYRVKVEYTAPTEDEMKKKKESVAKVVAESIRKNKK